MQTNIFEATNLIYDEQILTGKFKKGHFSTSQKNLKGEKYTDKYFLYVKIYVFEAADSIYVKQMIKCCRK